MAIFNKSVEKIQQLSTIPKCWVGAKLGKIPESQKVKSLS